MKKFTLYAWRAADEWTSADDTDTRKNGGRK